tara:strand:+ start:270 stop:668 length:399 start_codon:yes stop_codon:yes gene_type:complete
MSQYKISKKRLAQIIKEEYEAAMARTDEGHGAFGIANRDEDEKKSKKEEEDEKVDEAHCATNRDEDKKDKKKIKNPGPYYKGARTKAGVDDDGDGVPNNADPHPHDGSKKKKVNKESLDSIRTLIQHELKNL